MKMIKSKKKSAVKPAAAPARKTAVKAPSKTATQTKVISPAAAAPVERIQREITPESIASRAYHLWEQSGRPHGRDLEYWLQAEKQLAESQSFAA